MNGHKIINQNAIHFLTMTVVGWLDVFTRKAYKDVIIESLTYCQKHKGLTVYAYVIMSNHIHLIARAEEGAELSDIIRDFKKYTAKKMIQDIIPNPKENRAEWMLRLFKSFAKYNTNNKTYQFWQKDNQPMELDNPKWMNQKLDYIHLNPVRSGIVALPEHYLYSSARDYAGKEGILNIEILAFGISDGYIPS